VSIVFSIIDGAIWAAGGPQVLNAIWWLLIVALTIYLMLRAYQSAPNGERFSIPVIGALAENRTALWMPPGYCKR